MAYVDRLREAAEALRRAAPEVPVVGIVLGSGLGEFASRLGERVTFPYSALPHWPLPRVAGHDGVLTIGTVGGRRLVALAGRCHLYEGHDAGTVAFGVRALGLLGVKTLVLTNAAGGINAALTPGTLMVIDDHLNLSGHNPLVGPDVESLGARFADMSAVYSPGLRRVADDAGGEVGVQLAHGIYAAVLGPSYETPAEIRYLRTIGADAVGMSTVVEAIAARQMGLDVLGISCIANSAAGVAPRPLDHADVLRAAAEARGPLGTLLEAVVGRL